VSREGSVYIECGTFGHEGTGRYAFTWKSLAW
jgi:hypothetical protein